MELFDFTIMREEITPDNVLAMAENIAFMETRYQIDYMGSRMQKMYANLIADIKHKNDRNRAFSDSYDLVQEGALYLCEHYGEHLSDVIGHDKKGKKITVQIACIRKMMKLINRKTSDYYRSASLEHLVSSDEPSNEICGLVTELKEEVSEDYAVYDKIVESLNLTDNMLIALECRIAGLSYPEIGRILERATSTVFEYFIKMRQRYTAIYQ